MGALGRAAEVGGRTGGAAGWEGEGVRGGGAPGVTATCGRRRWHQVFLPTPALRLLPVLLVLGAAIGVCGWGYGLALAPGRCAGSAAGCACEAVAQ